MVGNSIEFFAIFDGHLDKAEVEDLLQDELFNAEKSEKKTMALIRIDLESNTSSAVLTYKFDLKVMFKDYDDSNMVLLPAKYIH